MGGRQPAPKIGVHDSVPEERWIEVDRLCELRESDMVIWDGRTGPLQVIRPPFDTFVRVRGPMGGTYNIEHRSEEQAGGPNIHRGFVLRRKAGATEPIGTLYRQVLGDDDRDGHHDRGGDRSSGDFESAATLTH